MGLALQWCPVCLEDRVGDEQGHRVCGHEDLPRETDEVSLWWRDNQILRVRGGSYAYGTNIETSDLDERAIALPPVRWLLGFQPNASSETHESRGEGHDLVVHTLRKFCALSLKGNPNTLEVLFCRDSDVLEITPVGEALRQIRTKFLSRQVYQSMIGYAASQLARMANHNTRHGAHADLIQQFGYDTKNAMHLIRLLRMGYEVLTTGELHIYRESDAQDLLAIRRGAWPESHVRQYAEELFQTGHAAVETSPLPTTPDRAGVEHWLMEVQAHWIQTVSR